ncbi:MAG: radical SAM family heme chaperone HemW [Candidatus Nanopelagicales bacterium]|nr:radical SAM family heme chaperone HemW [Candidatus Nanopelagicales bacterium]
MSDTSTLSLYVHVPFCSSRCGYCDFNTYTATELGNSVSRDTFHEVLAKEVRLAAEQLGGSRKVSTVFVGGGTPTLLGSQGLNFVLNEIKQSFGLETDAEVTTEANPDSVTPQMLSELREGGFTRISFGMQSSAPKVLQILERTHTPGASVQAAKWATDAGFAHVNLDLIYGTPGESDDELIASVEAALEAGIDHLSAYALIVEDGTALSRKIQRGELPMPDDDVCADRYEIIDARMQAAGLPWYEVSNWAKPGSECQHNLAYWRSQDWWGIGPGAHSHVNGNRWWNIKHPSPYAERIAQWESPSAGTEVLTTDQVQMEEVMLGVRLAEGIALDTVSIDRVNDLVTGGLVDPTGVAKGRVQLTLAGRLLADAVIRDLLSDKGN